MRPAIVAALWRKEVVSTLRDRRAVISTLVLPLIMMPLFMVGFPLLFGGLSEREAERVSQIGLQNGAALPEALRELITAQNAELVPTDDALLAVQDEIFPAALRVPDDLQARLAAGEAPTVALYSKAGNLRSELVASKLREALERYRQQLVRERLQAAGLDEAVLEPIRVEAVDASTPAEQGAGLLGWLIPYFIAIFTLTGGQMTAIDATAGEKERGTLESLLVAPVRRLEVVVGKALATMLFGLTAAVVGILSYTLSGQLLSAVGGSELGSVLSGSFSFELGTVLLLLVSALLMAALVSSLLVAIAMFARSFKQAQSYVAPLTFLLILPALGLQFADFFTVSNGLYAVPILNILLLMNDAVRGQASAATILITWGSSLVYAGLCLAFAYRNFQREDVIFRS